MNPTFIGHGFQINHIVSYSHILQSLLNITRILIHLHFIVEQLYFIHSSFVCCFPIIDSLWIGCQIDKLKVGWKRAESNQSQSNNWWFVGCGIESSACHPWDISLFKLDDLMMRIMIGHCQSAAINASSEMQIDSIRRQLMLRVVKWFGWLEFPPRPIIKQ